MKKKTSKKIIKDAKFYIAEIEKVSMKNNYSAESQLQIYEKLVKKHSENILWNSDKDFISKLSVILDAIVKEGKKGWIVNKDYTEVYDGKTYSEVSITGPSGCELTEKELLKGHAFRMFDVDNVLYYSGFFVGDKTSEDAFMPLENYGTPNAGCTSIQYKEGRKWKTL